MTSPLSKKLSEMADAFAERKLEDLYALKADYPNTVLGEMETRRTLFKLRYMEVAKEILDLPEVKALYENLEWMDKKYPYVESFKALKDFRDLTSKEGE